MSQDRIDNLFASESWTSVYTAFTNVSLKAYDFDSIRESLLAYISRTYPDKFNDFIASSEFIAILDLVAYLGHSLAFRNDMNTRENFLDTAERRLSILRMAQTLGYIKTRPINARGMMKITSVTTTEDVADNEGNSLAGIVVNWNDSNDVDWYEKFITVLNASFNKNTKIQDPSASLTVGNIENYLYEVNENPLSKSLAYAFSTNVAGANRRFEAVRTVIEDNKIIEGEPIATNNFTILNRNDNLGPGSDRTGFFVTTKAGQLKSELFRYQSQLSNRVEVIDDSNISNSDVWVQKFDTSNGAYKSSVTKVDNDTRETAIYNSLRTGSGDLVSVHTNVDNSVELRYPDGVFGNAAFGDYRVWYRTCDNENYSINSGDIKNVEISIPYIGTDDKSYRITLSLQSTRDFAENFAAETFTSVRRIAQKAYYSQDRMVNAQDYNIYPLTLGNNVVRKVKAVNTTFSGNSRYFEMDDVTGHHSNLSITGTDGSIFIENEGGEQPSYNDIVNNPPNWTDALKISLSYNRDSGKAVDFIRNELSKAIRHPAIVNEYFYLYRTNSNVNIDVPTSEGAWTKDPQNNLEIVFTNTVDAEEGDIVKIKGDSDEIYYSKVVGKTNGNESSLVLDKMIAEGSGTLVKIIKNIRMKFTEDEINEIKTQKIDDAQVQSFTLYYDLDTNDDTWKWNIWDGETDITGKIIVFYKYEPGFRTNETEYTAYIKGKKIVFESRDQVKFYYGNKEVIVDNETNLAERDKILINYYDEGGSGPETTEPDGTDAITVGYACSLENYTPTTNIINGETKTGATFDAVFKNTGADTNLDLIQDTQIKQFSLPTDAIRHELVSPEGEIFTDGIKITTASPNNIIGAAPERRLSLEVDDISKYTSSLDDISLNETVVTSTEYNISGSHIEVEGGSASSDSIFSSVTTENLTKVHGFKGKPSKTYLDIAPTTGNFFWMDESELTAEGKTFETAAVGDAGVTNSFVTSIEATDKYKFTYGLSTGLINLADQTDQDIRFKQTAYGEIEFSSSETLTHETLRLRNDAGEFIDTAHVTLESTAGSGVTNYKIIFWTLDIVGNTDIDVLKGDGSTTTDIGTFAVRVVADITLNKVQTESSETYRQEIAYVHDDYLTNTGYIDETRVKLLPMDTSGNPYGILDIFTGDNASDIVTEEYTIGSKKFERVSKIATAGKSKNGNGLVPESNNPDFRLWYKVGDDPNLPGEWMAYTNGVWRVLGDSEYQKVDNDPTCIYFGPTKYRVVQGRSFTEDKFMSFRWDHYADLDKRIDPSTSNIVDIYILTSDYVRKVNKWIAGGFKATIPTAPNNYELKSLMDTIEPKAAIADHISYVPVKFKYLFGSFAQPENQAMFKVVKKSGTAYTDSEVKTAVSAKVNEYFDLNNWDFGDTFYFSELASYLHQQLGNYIASVVITPKFSTSGFTDLLSITSEPNEIFLSVTTSADVKIISAISQTELQGEDVTDYGQ